MSNRNPRISVEASRLSSGVSTNDDINTITKDAKNYCTNGFVPMTKASLITAATSEVMAILLLVVTGISFLFGWGFHQGVTQFVQDVNNHILLTVRILGSTILCESLGCFALLVPIFSDFYSSKMINEQKPIFLVRNVSTQTCCACAITTSITGLAFVLQSLTEFYREKDRSKSEDVYFSPALPESHWMESGSKPNFHTFWIGGTSLSVSRLQLLAYVGTSVLILSCISLMASFWPIDKEVSNCTENDDMLVEASSDRLHFSNLSHELQEPLLGAFRNDHHQENLRSKGSLASTTENVADNLRSRDEKDVLADAEKALSEMQNSLERTDVPRFDELNTGTNAETGKRQNIAVDRDSEVSTSRIQGTRRLLSLAIAEVRYLYAGCTVLMIRLPFSIAIPHFVSTTLSALGQNDFVTAREEISWLLVIGTIDSVLDFWCVFLFGYANQRIVRNLRIDLFTKIIHQEIAFFDKNGSATLTSRLNSDCSEMSSDLTWFFRFSIESVVRITSISIYMFVRCPTLGACTLSIVPIVAFANYYYSAWLCDNASTVQETLAEANAIAQETLANVRTVLSFSAEELEIDRYRKKVNQQYRLSIRQLYVVGVYYMGISTFLINTIVQSILLLIGTVLIQRGHLSYGILLAFMLYQGQLQNEVMNLLNSLSSLVKSSGAGDAVFTLLDRKPCPPAVETFSNTPSRGSAMSDDTSDTHLSDDAGYDIVMKGITFCYPSRPSSIILDKIDLDIPHGQTVALVGASGCGKTTIINLLQRFYDPTDGCIRINGKLLTEIDIKEHRRAIGVVTQDPVLFRGSIWDNIAYGSEVDSLLDANERVERAAKLAHAHDFISDFPNGYKTEVGERGVQLSGGQKQRIAIARAIFQRRRLLLLDEATSALDTESEIAVQSALDELLLNREGGMTTVVIAHRLRTVRNADTIVVLQNGRVVEKGSHDDLMQTSDLLWSGGVYRRMVEQASCTGVLNSD